MPAKPDQKKICKQIHSIKKLPTKKNILEIEYDFSFEKDDRTSEYKVGNRFYIEIEPYCMESAREISNRQYLEYVFDDAPKATRDPENFANIYLSVDTAPDAFYLGYNLVIAMDTDQFTDFASGELMDEDRYAELLWFFKEDWWKSNGAEFLKTYLEPTFIHESLATKFNPIMNRGLTEIAESIIEKTDYSDFSSVVELFEEDCNGFSAYVQDSSELIKTIIDWL